MDEHWKPTFNYCSMCVLNYDYVIKFEDYLNEAKAFLKTSNLNTLFSRTIAESSINSLSGLLNFFTRFTSCSNVR